MKIKSIEPTPSPNAMKLNLDESLPTGQNYRFTVNDKEEAPPHLRALLLIDGVTGVFQVLDFISLDRHPKADWEEVLNQARSILGEADASTRKEMVHQEEQIANDQTDQDFMEVAVSIQKVKQIPMQIKLVKGNEEQRVGLPDRFKQAVMKVQQSVDTNLIFERKWEEQSHRYGELETVGEQVAEEIIAAYDDERLSQLVEQALQSDAQKTDQEKMSVESLRQALEDPDWKKRYQALERVDPVPELIPVLDQALEDKKQSIRRLAVVTLGFLEDASVLPSLEKALQDRSAIVRRTAGDTMSDLGLKEAIPAMAKALSDQNKLVRWRAARFLFEVGDESAIPALKQAIDDPEFEVRMQAQIALQRIEKGEEASGTVWQQMTRRIKEES